MRVFLALEVREQVEEEALMIKEELSHYKRYLRFVPEEQLHLTIKFLGNDVNNLELQRIITAVYGITENSHPYNLRLGSPKYGFENRRWPRVLFIPVVRNNYYNKFVSKISEDLSRINSKFRINIDSRPHITIARTKSRLNDEVIRSIQNILDQIKMVEAIRISCMNLIHSELTKTGPIYNNLKSFTLSS